MKVLRVIARLNVGGPARHVVLLECGLRARGYATLLVHGAVGPGEASLEYSAAGANLRAIKLPGLGPRISALSDARAFIELLRITFREAPDIIHTHTAKAGTLGRLSAAIFNLTRRATRRALVVHTFHGHVLTGYFGRLASMAVRTAERALATITDCVVTIAPEQRRDIVERFRIAPAERVVVVPLGLDLDRLLALSPAPSGLRQRLGIAANDIVVGYIGRFVRIKDLETLVAAFAAARREAPGAWLLMAGDGPLHGEVEAAAQRAGVADRVRCIGWVDDLAEFYGAIDICALSSLNEGTPVALIEAMAAGRPVVATAVGGVPDVVDHNRTGLLVPPRAPADLGRAIAQLANDAPKRSSMGAAARADIAERFTVRRLVDDIDRLYKTRLSAKRGIF